MLLSKNQLNKNICAVGGRSGGHLLPCIYYIAQKKKADPSINKTMLFYTSTDLTTSLIMRSHIINYPVSLTIAQIPYKKWYFLPSWIFQVCYSFIKSFFILLKLKPQEVMGSGGLESIPVCLAAWILRIPVILFELNAVPGKAILFLARFISPVYICFPETASYFPHNKTILTSYPVRFSQEELATSQSVALSHYQLDPYKKTIVILGGSQGSVSLNQIAIESVIQISKYCKQIQIIHQIGNDDFVKYKTLYHQHGIEGIVIPFEQHAHYLYSSADVIISRAGAGTLFEIVAFSKAACIVPLESSTTDHQKDNALALTRHYPSKLKLFDQKALENNSQTLVKALIEFLNLYTPAE